MQTMCLDADIFLKNLFEAVSIGGYPVSETLILMKRYVKTFVFRTYIYDLCLSYYGVTDINQLQTIYQLKYILEPPYWDMKLDTGDNQILEQIYSVTLQAVKYKLILVYKEIFEEDNDQLCQVIDRSYAEYALMFLTLTKQIKLDIRILSAFIAGNFFVFDHILNLGIFLTTPMNINRFAGTLKTSDIIRYFSQQNKNCITAAEKTNGYGLAVAYTLNPDLSSWNQGYYDWGYRLCTIHQNQGTVIVQTSFSCNDIWVLFISEKSADAKIGLDSKGLLAVLHNSGAWVTLVGGDIIVKLDEDILHEIKVFSVIA